MYRKLRKPLNVDRWGRQIAWEFLAAPQILAGLEPEHEPSGVNSSEAAKDIMNAMIAEINVGGLEAFRGLGDKLYLLAAEVVGWACKAGFSIPRGLAEEVQNTSVDYVRRQNAQKTDDAISKAKKTSAEEVRLELDPPASAELPTIEEVPSQSQKIKKKALADKLRNQWPTIENDLLDASRNGLTAARIAGALGYYSEEKAIQWAKERGKYRDVNTPADLQNSMFNLPISVSRRQK